MILISHRGNINGRIIEAENRPDYVIDTIRLGYNVEIDVWMLDNKIYLGHDNPSYEVSIDWICNKSNYLWVHCKNTEMLSFFSNENYDINYFWHETDTVTLTSKKYIWALCGKQPIKSSIAVMPEINNDNLSSCIGICSDYISMYTL